MLNLFLGHKVLFFSFFWSVFFFCVTSLCGLGTMFFFNWDHLSVAGGARVWVHPPVSSVGKWRISGTLFSWLCPVTRDGTSKPLS